VLSRVALCLLAVGCSGAHSEPDAAFYLCSDQQPAAPTFANVDRLFSSTCTQCHRGVELDLSTSNTYASLIDKPPPSYAYPPTNEACGTVLVKPGDPSASYLLEKLVSATPCAGQQMPLLIESGTPLPLPACEVALVRDWIAAGALDD